MSWRRFILLIALTIMGTIAFSQDHSYLTVNKDPIAIGEGKYSTNVSVCIGQKENSAFKLCMDVPISTTQHLTKTGVVYDNCITSTNGYPVAEYFGSSFTISIITNGYPHELNLEEDGENLMTVSFDCYDIYHRHKKLPLIK